MATELKKPETDTQETPEAETQTAASPPPARLSPPREPVYTLGGLIELVKTLMQREHNPRSRHRQHERIGQMLIDMDAIKQWHLDEAMGEQRRNGRLLGEILEERGYVDRETVRIALSKLFGLEYAAIEKTPSSPEALEAISERYALKYRLLPVRLEGDKLVVLIEDVQDRSSLEDVSVLLGMRLQPVLTTTDNIRQEIKNRYHTTKLRQRRPQSVVMTKEERAELAETMETLQTADTAAKKPGAKKGAAKKTAKTEATKEKEKAETVSRFRLTAQQASGMPVVKLVATIIEDAINADATDIHFDPHEPEMRLRYRVDGVLHDVMSIPRELESAVVSRIKIMGDLDITETRRPQDGHISLVLGDRECDVRVATLPTFLGERIVLRLLEQSTVISGIAGLGLPSKHEETLRALIQEPYGMILVTGPTGSGKTTTLYAALNQRNVGNESIVTLEDPVEYQLSGINQVQIDPDIDLTFARTLRASLRQDIDVLLIGEIRDAETAHIAIRAAMTGHLVFSTLHTNDAPEAITTMRNMGIPSYLMGSALTAIIAQRLVRKICTNCKKSFKPTKALLKSIGLPESTRSLYRGKGCNQCYNTGYHGRTGIFEILTVTPELRRMITDNETTESIITQAKLETMADICRAKVKEGTITPEEFLRVVRF